MISCAPVTRSQSIPVNGILYGESVVSAGSASTALPDGTTHVTQFNATGTQVYILVDDAQNGGLMAIGYNKSAWTAPAGTTIKDAKVKMNTVGTEHILVLLTNGTVYEIDQGHYPWQSQMLGSITDSISQTFEKVVGDDIYVFSTSHLYVTRDSGSSWQLDDSGTSGFKYDVAMDTGQNVFILTDSGLLKQTPHGTSWSRVAGSPAGTSVFIDRRNRILASGLYNNALYLSNDDGATWNMDTAGLYPYLVKKMADDAYGNLYVVAYNLSTYPPHDMVFRSIGGTGPWQEVDAGLNALINGPFAINSISGDTALSVATNFGFFFATDSGTIWGMNNKGINTGFLTTLVKQSNGRLLTTSPLGLYVIDVNDTAWHKTYPTNSYDCRLLIYGDSTSSTLYLQDQQSSYAQSSMLYNSTDNGNTWNIDTSGLYAVKASNIYVDEQGTQYLTNSSYGFTQHAAIYFRHAASSWTLDSAGIPWVNYATVTALCSDRNGYLYSSLSLGAGNSPIMRRPIGGGTWTIDTAGIPAASYIQYLASSSVSGIIAATGSSLYRRTPAGVWVTVPLPSQLSSPTIIAISVDGNGAIFASFYDNNHSYGDGVFFTKNNGNTWIYAGLQDLYAQQLISYGDTTYALTYDSWAYKLTETAYNGILDPVVSMSPVKAFPNPSQSGIWTVAIPDEWIDSRIEVSDMTGRMVYSGLLEQNASQLTLSEAGMYIAHVAGAKGQAAIKLVR